MPKEDSRAVSLPDDCAMQKRVLSLVARLLLENGGETYRAEESVERLCRVFGAPASQVIAIPTGIFLSLSRNGCPDETLVVRIKERTVDLEKLDRTNSIVRALCEGRCALADAEQELSLLSCPGSVSRPRVCAAAAVSAAAFTLLFGGGIFDSAVAAFCGAVCQLLTHSIRKNHFANFVNSLLGGAVTAALACTAAALCGHGAPGKIIIGAIMPMLPGLSMVNAIRDTARGDLVSGGARVMEMLLIAVSIAAGVGVVLALFHAGGGAVL